MQCHSCGTEVRPGQKFCMECGASLRGVADVTGEVPVVLAQPTADEATDDTTRPMAAVTAAVSTAMAPPRREADRTAELTVVEATSPPVDLTAELPRTYEPTRTSESPAVVQPAPRRRLRFRPLLVLALLGAAATVVGVLTTLIEITADGGPTAAFATGAWKVNDFGTNNSIAALIAAGTMVLGALMWCFGYRWGAGLAGGAGAALAGWAALVIGLAEWPISTAEAAAALAPSTITRDVGYWALVAAGAMGVVVLATSLVRAGRDGRAGLDPWVAALAAVSFLIAAGGPLIPEGTADWSGNYSSETLGVDLPTLFFVGRAIQLGLLALCGVVGFLLVRRFGLGLAVGSAVAAGWMLVTAATDQTADPIGPAYENPGSIDLQPHAVTVVGFALVGFFSLVAIVMALLDAER